MAGYGLAVLSGVLYALGYPGVGAWPLSFVAFVPLLHALDRPGLGPLRALSMGLVSGCVAHLLGCSWVFATLHTFAGFDWLTSVAVGSLLCLYQGGQLGLFGLLLWPCIRARRSHWAWLAPLSLAAVEWAYPQFFPCYAGASLRGCPVLLQLAELGGPCLVSMLVMALNVCVFSGLRGLGFGVDRVRRSAWIAARAPALLAVALLAGAFGFGALRMASVDARVARAPKLSVGIVQANMPAFRRREDQAEGRRRHVQQSEQLEASKPELLIWPETALHYPLSVEVRSVRPLIGSLVTPVLFGGLALRVENGRARLYNSAYLVDADGGVLGRSDKLRLIPFAEYVPWGEKLPALDRWLSSSGQMSPGAGPVALSLGDRRIAALGCYEDLLPDFVNDVVRQVDPQLLVSLSNDVWLGQAAASRIHQALASLRAIEHRRFLVRANNSGPSAVIDAAGRIVVETRPFERQNSSAKVALLSEPTWFERLGAWPGWLSLCVMLALAITSAFSSKVATGA